jgi:hypothetical protein
MAAIETLTGVDRVDEFVYDVTDIIDIGGNIDDVINSTFRMRAGGLLRFRDGCETTFTRCTFIEESTAPAVGSSNFESSTCRFIGSTCIPVFRGCYWLVTLRAGRHDFDVAPGARPNFVRDEFGNNCFIRVRGTTNFNHLASEVMVVDGLVFDADNGAAIEFIKPPPDMQNLTVVNRGSGRHVVILAGLWEADDTVRISKLKARNIATWEGTAGRVIELLDSVGDVFKDGSDIRSRQGVLRGIRTYRLRAFDPVAIEEVANSEIIITNSANAVIYDDVLTDGIFQGELLSYVQAFNSVAVEIQGAYRRALVKYGFLPAISTFSVNTTTFGVDGRDDGAVLLVPDTAITEPDKTIVEAYSTIDTPEDLYDYDSYYSIVRADRENAGIKLIGKSGNTVSVSGLVLFIDSAATPVWDYDGTTIVIKSSGFGSASRLALVDSTLRISGSISSAIDLDGDSILEVPDGTFNFASSTFALGAEINLRSGATEATVNVAADQSDNITAGSGVTIAAPELILTITGIPAGGIFSIWDDDDPDPQDLGTLLQETKPTSGASITYSGSPGNNVVYQFVPKSGASLGFQEFNVPGVIPATSQTLDLSSALQQENNI